ncbi:YceI family protein [Paludibacter propionicigenes WB4]|uniref:YceI family protein n=1 Tax=Paludibacter propionicigenes (strain DSM 17365 / JCM 13257 / WB4) TaxID=694427 RepID=E4T074_PALPW|nr:YceI family protein [Paludibacter propionicigenes]ADQ78264.1 YceI family protein [Paludibacter propionicigenes WB4]
MKKILFSILALSLSLVASAQQSWSNDPMHSRLGFVVKHLTISEISGQFSNFTVKVKTTKPDFMDMKVSVVAKTASISTGVEMRDNHLKTADFFDVEKYPELTFESTSLKKISDKKFALKGNLTLHGVTKVVTLNVTYFGTVVNPMNQKSTSGFHITATVKRSDFGIGPKFPEAVVSDVIRIVADAEFSKE